MRTLNINKKYFWMVKSLGLVDVKDDDGNFTGEKKTLYSTPLKIALCVYPSDGYITKQLFGTDVSLDLIACSHEVTLTYDTFIFINEPISDFDKTYDYSINIINESLNTFNYGLKRRI